MENVTQNIIIYIRSTIPSIKSHLEKWSHGVGRLEEEISYIKKDRQPWYREQIEALRQHLSIVMGELQTIARDDRLEVERGWTTVNTHLTNFRDRFVQIAKRMEAEEKVPLGWVQGFTEKRTHESEGWAQGFGERPKGSEGWAEGLGHQGDDSRGWAEGYDNQ